MNIREALYSRQSRRFKAFTLVELLVSIVILAFLSYIIFSLIDITSKTWKKSANAIDEFHGARNALTRLASYLEQATLHTYWDYDNQNSPTVYLRKSELHFICGQGSDLLPNLNNVKPVSHAVFFQSTLGYTNVSQASNLTSLLNATGYFVAFTPDYEIPSFISSISSTYRFRLYEYLEPSENLSVYTSTSGTGTSWFTGDMQFSGTTATAHAVADNIVALVVLPQESAIDDPTGVALAPQYAYDTRLNSTTIPQPLSANQLPPIIEVALIAVDESSSQRLLNGITDSNSASLALGIDYSALFHDASKLESDLITVQSTLTSKHIDCRIFRIKIHMRSAQWSGN